MAEQRDGVIVMVAGYPPAYLGGGPIRTIEAMVESRSGEQPVRVLTSAHDHGCSDPLDVPIGRWTTVGRAQVFYADLRSRSGKLDLVRTLRTSTASVLYLNSLFSLWFSVLPLLLVRLRVARFERVVVAPRGELDPGALAMKSTKKKVFLAVAKALGLHRDVTWHLSAVLEAANVRAVFPVAEVLVKENETLIRGREEADLSVRPAPVRFAYLGRVSRKKRVHLLIEAAAQLPSAEFELVVHGGGDQDYVEECRDLARRLGVSVDFTGPVAHVDVAAAFDAADFACFPTAAENFGHVIAEALGRGCPVLVGDVTPWTERVKAGGGEIVPSAGDAGSWAAVMGDLLRQDAESRAVRRGDALDSFKTWQAARPAGSFIDQLLALQH